MESSMVTRELCVQLVGVGVGLERIAYVDILFIESGYARSSKFVKLLSHKLM